MKKVGMLLCMLCLAVPMFAQNLSFANNARLYAKQPEAKELKKLQLKQAILEQMVTDENNLVGPFGEKQPQNKSKRAELRQYLVEEARTLNEFTQLERVVHLIVAGDVAFSDPNYKSYISENIYFPLVTLNFRPHKRSMKEKLAVYYAIEKMGMGEITKDVIYYDLFGNRNKLTKDQLEILVEGDIKKAVNHAMFEMWQPLDAEGIDYDEEPEEVADVFLTFLKNTKDEQ